MCTPYDPKTIRLPLSVTGCRKKSCANSKQSCDKLKVGSVVSCTVETCQASVDMIRTRELRVDSTLYVGCEQADPEALRLPITVKSTVLGTNFNTNVNQPALPFPNPVAIPQGIFSNDSSAFFGSRFPNYVALMSTSSAYDIENWRKARSIESEIVIFNNSSQIKYDVVFILIGYSRDESGAEIAEILGLDANSLNPGYYHTYNVRWVQGKGNLPILNNANQVSFFTSVVLVNTLSTITDLKTFAFQGPSLQTNILLTY